MAIIGIVAALTIPTLVAKNEKKQLYTQFMKTYNTLINAANLSQIDNGDPVEWLNHRGGSYDYLEKYLIPYLKSPKVCDKIQDCFHDKYTSLSGRQSAQLDGIIEAVLADSNVIAIQLPDGSSVLQYDNYLIFDTNGKKGPNSVGRDLLIPVLSNNSKDTGKIFRSYPDSDPSICVESDGMDSFICVKKLVVEGAMNY